MLHAKYLFVMVDEYDAFYTNINLHQATFALRFTTVM